MKVDLKTETEKSIQRIERESKNSDMVTGPPRMSVENKIEKLNSKIAESRELTLAWSKR
jgi:hypothetical protein